MTFASLNNLLPSQTEKRRESIKRKKNTKKREKGSTSVKVVLYGKGVMV